MKLAHPLFRAVSDAVRSRWIGTAAAPEDESRPRSAARSRIRGAAFGRSRRTRAETAQELSAWQKDFAASLAQNERIELLHDRELKLIFETWTKPSANSASRLQEAQREARDEAVDAMRKKYAARQAQLEDRVRRAETDVAKESQQASQAKLQTAVSVGAAVLGALFGRKTVSVGNLGRATTAARGVGRSMKESRGRQTRVGECRGDK